VTDVRLARNEREGDLVAEFAPAQIPVEDERELIGRTEARSAGHRPDDRGSRFLQEALVIGKGLLGVVTERLRLAALAGELDDALLQAVDARLQAGNDHTNP